MAPKTVKKAPAKKTVAKKALVTAVKPVVKAAVKPVAKAAAKPVVKSAVKVAPKAVKSEAKPVVAPVVSEKTSTCCMGGNCKCGGFGRFLKKLVLLVVIFALGVVAAKFIFNGSHQKPQQAIEEIFTNGCLDVTKVDTSDKSEFIVKVAQIADTDADGCITVAEFTAAKDQIIAK